MVMVLCITAYTCIDTNYVRDRTCFCNLNNVYNTIVRIHSVLTICTQTGTCDTRSGDLVFFSAAFDEFSLFAKN